MKLKLKMEVHLFACLMDFCIFSGFGKKVKREGKGKGGKERESVFLVSEGRKGYIGIK